MIKFELLGAGANEQKAGNFLGRTIKWTKNGLTYKGDDKLLESLHEEWNVLSKLLENGSTLKSTKRLMFGKRQRNWAVSLSMGKTSESFDVNLREGLHGKMSVIELLPIGTLEMFLNESGMSEVCL